MVAEIDLLRVAQGVLLILGAIVVYYGLVSYRRTKNRAMLMLAIGFGFVTIGAVAGGIIYEVLGGDLLTADLIQAAARVIGFLFIIYSILGIKH